MGITLELDHPSCALDHPSSPETQYPPATAILDLDLWWSFRCMVFIMGHLSRNAERQLEIVRSSKSSALSSFLYLNWLIILLVSAIQGPKSSEEIFYISFWFSGDVAWLYVLAHHSVLKYLCRMRSRPNSRKPSLIIVLPWMVLSWLGVWFDRKTRKTS